MTNQKPAFKPSQRYDWGHETKEEAHSSFFDHSGYAPSGYEPMPRKRRRTSKRPMWLVIVAIALGVACLAWFARRMAG